MQFHLDAATQAYIAEGLPPEEARRRALVDFGALELAKDEVRDLHPFHWIEEIGRDLRYAARQLRRNAAFTATVLLTLGLCIGANTAIYTIVDRLFFRPLPYPEPNRLLMLSTMHRKGGALDITTGQDGRQWEIIRDHATSLDSAVYGGTAGVNLYAGGRVEYVQEQRVSANFFHMLGITPRFGREFLREEDVPNGPQLAVLSSGLWQRVFRADPSIVGRIIDLRGAPYTVVGIVPQGFLSPFRDPGADQTEIWTPLHPSRNGEGGGINYQIIGRLKPGVTFAQANGQLRSITHDYFAAMHLPKDLISEETAIPLQTGITYDLRSAVRLMWAAVLLVLVIGCVNIAGILLARSATRSREIATRLALGAGRGRIISELLTEALLLALFGGLIGLVLGELALQALIHLNASRFDMAGPIHLDARVMAVMIAVSLVTSIFFGLFPAFEATSLDLRSALAEGGRGNAGGRRQWKRQALVFAEVALGVVLVAGAGLLIRTFMTLANASPGFDPNRVITATVSLQAARYATSTAGARLFRQSLDRIREIPGIESAAVAFTPPYGRPLNDYLAQVAGSPAADPQITNFTYATPGMFETLRMRLLRGRLFTDRDNAHAARVAVVNQAFVNLYLRNRPDPLGTPIKIENTDWQIIGIVNNVQEQNGWGGPFGPLDQFGEVYVPVEQFPDALFAMANTYYSPVWIVRTHSAVPGLREAMQRALASVDSRLPFSSFKTMPEVRGASMQDQRYRATFFSALAGLAVLLAAVGVYGLIVQSVAQRTREFGIRLALGAVTQNIVRAAVLPGIKLSVTGIACGIILSLFAMRLLKSLIWGVTTTDTTTFIAAATLLVTVAAFASLIPALRLVNLDPAQTLRDE
jgi:predicted permease